MKTLPRLRVSIVVAALSIAATPCSANDSPTLTCYENLMYVEKLAADGAYSDALEVVSKYWASDYPVRYDLFEPRYQIALKRAFGIDDAAEYSHRERKSNYERTWDGYKVLRVEQTNEKSVTITALVCWNQDGYRGFRSFLFELVNRDGKWKISHIAE